jgi:hypothetical protein
VLESSQAWQVGVLTAFEAQEDFMDYAVQTVRGFRWGNARAASHLFYDIRLLHSGFTVASRFR